MSGGGGGRDDGYSGSIRPSSGSGGGKADGPGSGGGGDPTGGGGGGGSGSGEADQCAISQRAPLNSPVPPVVATLHIGEILQVVLVTSGGRPVLEVRKGGTAAGALTHRGHLTLIQCIQDGWNYEAVVINITGGLVELRIQSA